MPLNTQPNFSEPGVPHRWAYTPGDAFYDALIVAHQGLADAQSELLNARLVLLLANHVGDLAVLREAIALARTGCQQ
jgi:predicted LPLAT superfamily acyltransferase